MQKGRLQSKFAASRNFAKRSEHASKSRPSFQITLFFFGAGLELKLTSSFLFFFFFVCGKNIPLLHSISYLKVYCFLKKYLGAGRGYGWQSQCGFWAN